MAENQKEKKNRHERTIDQGTRCDAAAQSAEHREAPGSPDRTTEQVQIPDLQLSGPGRNKSSATGKGRQLGGSQGRVQRGNFSTVEGGEPVCRAVTPGGL